MVMRMEIILIILLLAAIVYFVKGMRTQALLEIPSTSIPLPSPERLSPSLRQDLVRLAETLFTAQDADAFKQQLALYDEDHAAFIRDYQSDYGFLDPEEFATTSPAILFVYFADELHDYLCNMDWTGEYDQDQLKTFIQSNLDNLGFRHFDWSFLERFEQELDIEGLQRGDYIIQKMIAIDERLAEIHYKLVQLDVGWDAYLVFIVHELDFEPIAHIAHEHFRIQPVSDWRA